MGRKPTEAQFEALNLALSRNYRRLAAHAVDLVKRGRRRHGSLPAGDEAGDLLQEALLQLTSGQRSWPEDVAPETALKMVMLSLADHRWRSPKAREVSLERMVEGPGRPNRQESESDSDLLDQMKLGEMGDEPSDDPPTDNAPADPREGAGASKLYRLTAEELCLLKEREEETLRQIDKALHDDSQGDRVVRCILDGCTTPREIAEDLGITIIETYHAIRRLKRKLGQFVPGWKA